MKWGDDPSRVNVLMSLRGDTVHAADDGQNPPRTICGRDAFGWNEGTQLITTFIDSANSCKRCVRIVIG